MLGKASLLLFDPGTTLVAVARTPPREASLVCNTRLTNVPEQHTELSTVGSHQRSN